MTNKTISIRFRVQFAQVSFQKAEIVQAASESAISFFFPKNSRVEFNFKLIEKNRMIDYCRLHSEQRRYLRQQHARQPTGRTLYRPILVEAKRSC